MTATRTLRAVGFTLAVGLALGCTAASTGVPAAVGPGPLGAGGDAVTSCMVKRHASEMVVGLDVVSNSSPTPVTLDRASLVGATGVRLVEARVADVSGDKTLFGHANGIPPTGMTKDQQLLVRSSQPLAGFALASASTGAIDNVLLYLRLDSRTQQAEIEHLRVEYHQGSQQFVWQDNAHYVLYPGRTCPSS